MVIYIWQGNEDGSKQSLYIGVVVGSSDKCMQKRWYRCMCTLGKANGVSLGVCCNGLLN